MGDIRDLLAEITVSLLMNFVIVPRQLHPRVRVSRPVARVLTTLTAQDIYLDGSTISLFGGSLIGGGAPAAALLSSASRAASLNSAASFGNCLQDQLVLVTSCRLFTLCAASGLHAGEVLAGSFAHPASMGL